MTTAEKLIKVAENEAIVKDAVEQLDLCLKGDKVDGKSWYDEFWDEALKSGGSWIYRFAGYCWTDKTFKPTQDLITHGNSNNIFNNSLITDLTAILNKCGVRLDVSQAISVSGLFTYSKVTRVPFLDCRNCTTINGIFSNAVEVIEIEGIAINENCNVHSSFINCTKLEKLIMSGTIGQNGFDVHWSTKLSADSLKSIINALSTTTTGLTITLPTTAQSNYEKVYGSGSWATLTATRSNWTIAYA
jgi:hypothetical protein